MINVENIVIIAAKKQANATTIITCAGVPGFSGADAVERKTFQAAAHLACIV
jgi:hypothetical protein